MQVVRKDNSPTNITLVIEGEAADLQPIYRHVLSHFKQSVKVPGFRNGKAPVELLEKHVNQQRLLDEFMEHAINDLYRRAIDQEQIRPVNTPNVQLKKFVPYTQLEFEAETEVLGQIKLPNYKAMKQARPKVTIIAKDVDEVINSLRTRMAERAEVERESKLGDELTIDFSGVDSDGKKIGGAEGKDYPLVLGSNTFIPGFEDHLLGVGAGQTKKFDINFPKDYGVAAMQNKKVNFTVNVIKVQELKSPKIDDEFAKKAGPFKSLAELKADIKKQLQIERQQQADNEYQTQLVRKIVEKSELAVPKSLVEEENLRLEDQEKQNLAYRGETWQEHLKAEGVTEEEHRQRHLPEAVERVKSGLVLSEIAAKEGLSVTPEELEIRLQILKGQYQDQQMQAELDKPENRRDIESRLLTEKTLAKLTEYAGK